jgi:putative FmdB family regulatory protein
MPIFEYVCRECDHQFETIIQGKQKAHCPKCESRKLDQQLSRFAVSGSEKSATPMASSPCGSCGDPRGPGSCSMN